MEPNDRKKAKLLIKHDLDIYEQEYVKELRMTMEEELAISCFHSSSKCTCPDPYKLSDLEVLEYFGY